MTKEQREELESMELNLKKDIRDTFGDELGKSFEKFLDELHKHIENDDKEKPKYKGSIAEEIEKEIADFAKSINKKISKHKDELKKYKFGMILATHSCGSPTMFMGAGCKTVVRKEMVPFIKSELEE